MDFDSIKEQIIERAQTYWNMIQDTGIYINLKERYDTLNPNIQQVLKYASIFMVVYFVYSIPASFVSSASEKLTLFEENRQLTRDLIRAGRIAKTIKLPPLAPDATSLPSRVEQVLTAEQILPEQKVSVTLKEGIASKALVPASLKQTGVKVNLKKLNLRQVVRVGEALNQIDSSRLINVAIQADTKDPHYFAVDYQVASFEVPREKEETGGTKKGSKFKPKKKGSRKK